jgi:uncharacterized membrane protein YedE/YeeE
MKGLISFIVGLLFALGLGLSGMTQTHVVKGFLDVFGEWNLNLMGVMIGAIAVHSIVYHFIKKKESPLFDSKFHLPTKKDLDGRLITGAAIFGLGWGWAGICPGPGIVSLVSGDLNIVVFILSMTVGMYAFKFYEEKFLK